MSLYPSPQPGKYNVTETHLKLIGAAKFTLPLHLSKNQGFLSADLSSHLLEERVHIFINEHVLLPCLLF